MFSVTKLKPNETGLLIRLVKDLLIELGDEAKDLEKLEDHHIA